MGATGINSKVTKRVEKVEENQVTGKSEKIMLFIKWVKVKNRDKTKGQ